jgi:hypothetical protein
LDVGHVVLTITLKLHRQDLAEINHIVGHHDPDERRVRPRAAAGLWDISVEHLQRNGAAFQVRTADCDIDGGTGKSAGPGGMQLKREDFFAGHAAIDP